jgi:hypothetical protein
MPEHTREYEFIEYGTFEGEICWFYRASDTGDVVGMINPRWGVDGDEDGTWSCLEHDGRVVNGHRATDDESDEYDDLYSEVQSHMAEVGS